MDKDSKIKKTSEYYIPNSVLTKHAGKPVEVYSPRCKECPGLLRTKEYLLNVLLGP